MVWWVMRAVLAGWSMVRGLVVRRFVVWWMRMFMLLKSLKLSFNVVLQPRLSFEAVSDEFLLRSRGGVI